MLAIPASVAMVFHRNSRHAVTFGSHL